MIKEKVFPNFWQTIIIISCCTVTYLIIYYSTLVLIFDHQDSNLYKVIQIIALTLNYIPYIIYLKKKTKIKLIDYLDLPDLETLLKIIIISFLVRFVIVVPFDSPDIFFNNLLDSSLRFYSISLNSNNPGFVIGLKWIFIPLAEEIIFRGFVLRQFLKQFSPTKAILLSSLIFGLYHVNMSAFIALFIDGIILSIIYYKTNSILISTLSHYVLYNGLLKFDNLDLNSSNLIIFISIFVISILIVIFLFKKPMRTAQINMLTDK